MKTTHKVILTGLICAIPLGLLAHDKYEDRYENHKSEAYHDNRSDDDHDSKYEREYFIKKGVNYVFEGKLEEKPKTGFTGVWKVSGNKIIVDDTTVIVQTERTLSIGDELYIAAKRQNGQIKAVEIEQD